MNLDPAKFHRLIALLEETRLKMKQMEVLSIRIEDELKSCIHEQV